MGTRYNYSPNHAHRCVKCFYRWEHPEHAPFTESADAFRTRHTCPECGAFQGWRVPQVGGVGLEISLKDGDKKWLEAQKSEVFRKVDDARGTAVGVGAVLFLGSVFAGAAALYGARRK